MARAPLRGVVRQVGAPPNAFAIIEGKEGTNKVYFANKEDMGLAVGSVVLFQMDEDETSEKERPTVKWLQVVGSSDYQRKKEWLRGVIVEVDSSKLMLRPTLESQEQKKKFSCRMIDVNVDLMPHHMPAFLPGDALTVQVIGGQQNKVIKACKAKVESFQSRPLAELHAHVASLTELMRLSQHRDEVMLHTLHARALWVVIFNVMQSKENVDRRCSDEKLDGNVEEKEASYEASVSMHDMESRRYCQSVLILMHLMITRCHKNHLRALRDVLDLYLRATHMIDSLGSPVEREREQENVVFELTQLIAHHYVNLRPRLKSLMQHLDKSKLLKLMDTLVGEKGSEQRTWRLIPTIPDADEMLEQKNLMVRSSTLRGFKATFESSESYLDHFYRLMRCEAFHLLQDGMRKLKSNRLDPRDLLLFKGIHLQGIYIDNDQTHLLVTFDSCLTRHKLPKDWKTSSLLKIGSLLCLLLSDNQMLWATVSDRFSEELTSKRLFGIALLNNFNTLSIAEAIMRLSDCNNCQIYMAESPVLFPSVGPILEALKLCRLEDFELSAEIVEAKNTEILPKYLNTEDAMSNLAKSIEKLRPTLNEDQFDALKHIFERRLSIVQGPPGCGKTFLGVRVVELFLNHLGIKDKNSERQIPRMRTISPISHGHNRVLRHQNTCISKTCEMEGIVLVLTYKNHALDEFLKHLTKIDCLRLNWRDKLVRIGGRSSEPELDCVNLNNLKKIYRESIQANTKHRKKSNLREEYYDTKNLIGDLRRKLEVAVKELVKKTVISPDTLYWHLQESQIIDLLFSTPWHKMNVPYGPKKKMVFTLSDIKRAYYILKGKSSEDFLKLMECHDKAVDSNRGFLKHAFIAAAQIWWPHRSHYNVIWSLSVQVSNEPDFFKEKMVNLEEEDYLDEMEKREEEEVNEILEARMSDHSSGNDVKDKRDKRNVTYTRVHEPFWIGRHVPSTSSSFNINDMGLRDIQSDYNPRRVTHLSEIQKVKFILGIIARNRDDGMQDIESILLEIEALQQKLKSIDVETKYELLKTRSVIGMTITGASINSSLLRRLNPKLVVVEEAAEVLEPSLVAALTNEVEHLVLIGDHKQLKPQVSAYELVKDSQFNTSMMERLIQAGYPYAQLRLQSRMRPEFAQLIKDIYPDYESNMERVMCNKALKCLQKSMFVWSHKFKEDGADQSVGQQLRSKVNSREADLAIALALFIVVREPSVRPSQITILGGYLGQVKHIRLKLSNLRTKDKWFKKWLKDDDMIDVNTIDNFQGDENDYVIVSLVRSNGEGTLGFINTLNRRCVAQSRARKGMYFVCNTETLLHKQSSVWRPFLGALKKLDCVSPSIVVQCPRHPATNMHIQDSKSMMDLASEKQLVCSQPCGSLFPCQDPTHACKIKCSSCHSEHSSCNVMVSFLHKHCGHAATRRCYEPETSIKCKTIVFFTFSECRHPGSRMCLEEQEQKKCKKPCPHKMTNCEHKCRLQCGQLPHDHEYCKVQVGYIHPECGHESADKKDCSGAIQASCNVKVDIQLKKCGHIMQKLCHQKEEVVKCTKPCSQMKNCQLHLCKGICGEVHDHDTCKEPIEYIFPSCGHPSPKKKKCSEKIAWPCTHLEYVQHTKCGHVVKKKCFELMDQVICPHKPCPRKRPDCGHECFLSCGEDCGKGECRVCSIQFEENLKCQRERIVAKVKELNKKLRKGKGKGNAFTITELKKEKATMAEYLEIHDKVMNTLKEEHKWYPTVTAIKKVQNLRLLKNFHEASLRAFDPEHISLKFHGTSSDGVKGITENGFTLPKEPGMFGKGVYLATNSSKSAQEIYTKKSNKLLLCRVLLGRSKEVREADKTLEYKKLRDEGFDSVTAPRGSKVKNDEFIVYDPRQAYPLYIIEYTTGCFPDKLSMNLRMPQYGFQIIELTKSRTFDPNDMNGRLWDTACAVFHRFQRMDSKTPTKIEYICNPVLEAKFEATRKKFNTQKKPDKEILAFHGTDRQNIMSIAQNNLDISKCRRFAHGHGFYLSEYPDVSQGYGDGLLLFRVLLGRETVKSSNDYFSEGFDSKKIPGQNSEYGQMNIIPKADQLLPFFIYRF